MTVQVDHAGSPLKPVGEIRSGYSPSGRLLAAVEPMHGNSLVCDLAAGPGAGPGVAWTRDVVSDKLSEGHALACRHLLDVGSNQIVVGWRGKPGVAEITTGVALWIPLDAKGKKWREK